MPVDALIPGIGAGIAGPGVHALIVGVSDYLHLPDAQDPPRAETWNLSRLTSGALSAYRVHDWLMKNELRLPLKSMRVLLSPSAREVAAEPALGVLTVPADGRTTVPRASRQAFYDAARAWRNDASNDPDDMMVFYFAGHGLQRVVDEGILLLDDFLEDRDLPFQRCAVVANLRDGTTPSDTFPQMAKTQFFFIDACQMESDSVKRFANPQVPHVFGAETDGPVDQRQSAVLFSTVNRAVSIGRDGMPSHFAEALLLAFERAAEEPQERHDNQIVWPVTASTIKTAIGQYYARKNLGIFRMDAFAGEPVLRHLPAPPQVDLAVHVRPDLVQPDVVCSIVVCDVDHNDLPNLTFDKSTFDIQVAAGYYRIRVTCPKLVTGSYKSQAKYITQRVPQWQHNLASSLAP